MIDTKMLKTIPLGSRKNLVALKDLLPLAHNSGFKHDDLNILAGKIVDAQRQKRKCVVMMGAHLIKVGMSCYIIDLVRKGFISHLVMNGAGPIHDFELALIGATSEDVKTNLEDATFGMADETGRYLNLAAREGYKKRIGYGKSLGMLIGNLNCPNKDISILYNAHKYSIPVSVFTAIGTEIIYQHPDADGAALGGASFIDFHALVHTLTGLEGGVIVNIGSAVICPEAFLKALTMARNMGYTVQKFTSANLDMIDHYRPRVNVLYRPTSQGGLALNIIARHEETIPALYHRIINNKDEGL